MCLFVTSLVWPEASERAKQLAMICHPSSRPKHQFYTFGGADVRRVISEDGIATASGQGTENFTTAAASVTPRLGAMGRFLDTMSQRDIPLDIKMLPTTLSHSFL